MHKEIEKRTMSVKDIAEILDRSERTGRRQMAKIRKYYKKRNSQAISIKEFCGYTGFTVPAVMQFKIKQEDK